MSKKRQRLAKAIKRATAELREENKALRICVQAQLQKTASTTDGFHGLLSEMSFTRDCVKQEWIN